VFGVSAALTLLQMALLELGQRHALFFVAPLAMAVPVGVARLLSSIPSLNPTRSATITATVVSAAVVVWFWGRQPQARDFDYPEDAAVRALVQWFDEHTDVDDMVRECSILGLEAHWYPLRRHDGMLDPYGGDWGACMQYVLDRAPPGITQWVVLTDYRARDSLIEELEPFSAPPIHPADHGWTQVHEIVVVDDLPHVLIWHRHGAG